MASKNQRLKATVTVGGALSESFKGAMTSSKKQINRVGGAISQLKTKQKRLNRVADHWDKWGKDASRYRQELKRVNQQVGKLQRSQERLGRLRNARNANTAKRGALRGKMFGAVAVGAAFAAPVAQATKFETVMARLAQTSDLTNDQLSSMRKRALGISRNMPLAADEVIGLMKAAAPISKSTEDMAAFAKTAGRLSVAWDTSGEKVGDILGKWRVGLKLTKSQAHDLADATTALADSSDLSAVDIGTLVAQVGSLAKQSGISTGATAALAASMVDAGADGSKARRAIRRLATSLTEGDSASTRTKKAFNDLGFSASGLADRMQDDAAGTIELVLKRIKELDKADRPAVLTDIFGRGASEVISPLITNLDNLKKNLDLVSDKQNYAGAAQKDYARMAKTTGFQLGKLKSELGAVGVTIGSVLLPPVVSITKKLGSFLGKVSELSERFPKLTKAVVGSLAGLASLRIITLAGGWAFTFLKGGVLSVAETFERARLGALMSKFAGGLREAKAGMVAFNIAAYANPIGLVVGAIVGGALLIRKYWEPIKAVFSGVWKGIKSKMGSVGEVFSHLLDKMGPVGDFLRKIGGWIGDVVGWFGDLLDPVHLSEDQFESFQKAGEKVGEAIGGVFMDMAKTVGRIFNWFAKKIKWLTDKLSFLGKAYKKIVSIGSTVNDTINNAGNKAVGALNSAINKSAAAVSGWLGIGGDSGQSKPSGRKLPANLDRVSRSGGKVENKVEANQTVHLTINQQPGEDSDAVAERAVQKMRDENERRQRGALFDRGPAYGY